MEEEEEERDLSIPSPPPPPPARAARSLLFSSISCLALSLKPPSAALDRRLISLPNLVGWVGGWMRRRRLE